MSTSPRKQPHTASAPATSAPAGDAPADAPVESAPGSQQLDQTHTSSPGTKDTDSAAESPADLVEGQPDIDDTRNAPSDAEGETEELARKVDMPARVKDKLHETVESVEARAGQVTQEAQTKAREALAKLAPPARAQVEQLSATARQRPVVPIALVALIVGVALWRLLRRTR
jgi:hypothetical protein